ncbi:histidine phosphatase superfamily [Rhypophila decipiens]|uniref:Histidine phosphatase superfamily n=1 Tax=Rhypophila decipiens TaxID=261697 RepID=A0AAN6XXH6_9PEZI|nr:histidine phosphatase superfamily [Rhypophila decipiens]
MVVKRILITRHGFRANWAGEQPPADAARYPDIPLSIHGEKQAAELRDYLKGSNQAIDLVVSSPFVRCVQTVEPVASNLNLDIWPEWYGKNRNGAEDSQPAPLHLLHDIFPAVTASYETIEVPNPDGEGIADLYDRSERVLSALISRLDEDLRKPRTVLICTHAATFVALCRVLAGQRPEDPTMTDFVPYTTCLTVFERNKSPGSPVGSWVCTQNGDCSFLSAGRQRGWRFSGKESFDSKVPKHGVDAGTGLGVVVED